jgi:uncharacterized alkaline shock family protein YloU
MNKAEQSDDTKARLEVHSNEGPGPKGKITMSEDVVATIAGLAARDVEGIHSLGGWRLIPFGSGPTRGINAEVGAKQAAFDIDAVVDHGVDIRDVANRLRAKIAEEVDRMTGREVVEVNIHIVGLHMPDDAPLPAPAGHSPRVV